MLKLCDKKMVQINGFRKQMIDLYECSICGLAYPVDQGVISWNGQAITDCPYCKKGG